MITYNEILDRMKTAFFEKSGENADTLSDLGIRFQAVASELFSLTCRCDYLLRQAFPQTATGEYLDAHAALRDITRKTAAKAYGALTFSVSDPAQEPIAVPAHTVCSVSGKPFLQFETAEDAAIEIGGTEVTVAALSTEEGSAYNVPANSITVMVNPPAGIESVTNTVFFDGGSDAENDAMLRRRILDAYRIPQSGFSAQSLREAIMKNCGVLDANVTIDDDSICVYVIPREPQLTQTLIQQIENCLSISDVTEATTYVRAALKGRYSFVVTAETECQNTLAVREELAQRLQQLTDGLRIGESLNLKKAASQLMRTEGVKNCTVQAAGVTGDTLFCPSAGYIRAERITVNCYDV